MRLEDEELTGRETAQDAGITAVAMGGHPFVPGWPLQGGDCSAMAGREHFSGRVSRQQSPVDLPPRLDDASAPHGNKIRGLGNNEPFMKIHFKRAEPAGRSRLPVLVSARSIRPPVLGLC